MRPSRIPMMLIVFFLFFVAVRTDAADAAALDSSQFDERVLRENGDAVLRSIAGLDSVQQFETLRAWVLPSATHNTIRLTATFIPLHHTTPETELVNLASPALDLIRLADELKRLDELAARIVQYTAATEQQQRCQLALSTIVQIYQRDFDRAGKYLGELIDRQRMEAFPELHDRWPETLVAALSLQLPALRDDTEELLKWVLHNQVRQQYLSGPDPWDRLIQSLVGQLNALRSGDSVHSSSAGLELTEWSPVRLTDAGRSGSGCPASLWKRQGQTVTAVAHHFNDYLYYRIPLRGNYQLECDLGGFNYKDAQVLAAGEWVGPAPTHNQLLMGSIRTLHVAPLSEPRLPEIGDWMRMKVNVMDGVCRASVNGRVIQERDLTPGHSPWLSVRMPFYSFGSVRNISLTGNPIIPETLNLISDVQLSDWVSHYGEVVGEIAKESDWWCETDVDGNTLLRARKDAEFAGTGAESLIRYHRPVIEDGVIEFEFYYSPNQSAVHPVIGRNVMLIRQNGLAIHPITDGVFDRTERDPLNKLPLATNWELPILQADSWNHVELRFKADSITLIVNGKTVLVDAELPFKASQPGLSIEAARNERKFGLFHFRGETEVRVRHLTWTGDWPRSLPAQENQELHD